MRKKASMLFFVLLSTSITVAAQRSMRVGYIDMDYILENVSEYQEAQSQLDAKVAQWKVEIEKKQSDIDAMKKALENERVLLTQELIDEREEEIKFVQQELFDYQDKRFGAKGDLMIQQRTLIEPVQDQVFNAVQELGKAKKYDYILDKSKDLVMLFANERNDVSDQVLLSINRASRRTQVNSRSDRKELEQDESRDVEQEREVLEREREESEARQERDSLVNERKSEREQEREARKRAYEERRSRVQEERQRRKDSISAVRNNKTFVPRSEAEEETQTKAEPSAEERRQQILEERQNRKDSIIQSRQRRKDSIIEARNIKRDSINN